MEDSDNDIRHVVGQLPAECYPEDDHRVGEDSMKVKHIIIAILSLYILLSVQGCAEKVSGEERYDKWQWMAGEMYLRDSSDKVCRHRCAIIAKQMMQEDKVFDLVFGTAPWSNKKHVRIEYWKDGELIVLEPMWSDTKINKFVEDDRWAYVPNNDANIRIISWVNWVLLEIGEEPYKVKE